MLVYGDCLMIYGDLWWFMVRDCVLFLIYGDLTVIYGDFKMIYDDV